MFLKTAENNLESLGNALGKKLGTTIGSGDKTNNSLKKDSLLSDLQSKITTTFPNGKEMTIAPEVYEKFAQSIYEKIKRNADSKKYSTEDYSTLTNQFLSDINSAISKIDDTKVTAKVKNAKGKVDKITYTIHFELSLSSKGQSVISANVSNGTNNARLTVSSSAKKPLAKYKYCAALYTLGKEALNDVLSECVNVFKDGTKDLLKAIYSAAPVDDQIQEIIDMTKEKTKEAVKEEIKAALPKNSSLNKALTKYESLTSAYIKLKAALYSVV